MPKKKHSYEFIKSEFEKRGYELIETEYINSKTKMRYKCPSHPDNELYITYNDLQQGTKCPYCFGNKKLTYEFIKEEFEKKGYILLENKYINNSTEMKYICSKHPNKELYINYNDFKRSSLKSGSKGCLECNYKSKNGEKNKNNYGNLMEIINFRRNNDIDIRFEDGTIVKHKCYSHFKNGEILSPYCKTCQKTGYIGEGKYKMGNIVNLLSYKKWTDMFQRCYNKKHQEKRPSYIGCTVCEEWHNFQNFAQWFDDNYYQIDNEEMHLDKDILIKGNKIYSYNNCCFVPKKINSLMIPRKKTNIFPVGVTYNSKTKKYKSVGKTFLTIEESFIHYKQTRETRIKEVANEYKGKIPNNVYDALMNYEVEITD